MKGVRSLGFDASVEPPLYCKNIHRHAHACRTHWMRNVRCEGPWRRAGADSRCDRSGRRRPSRVSGHQSHSQTIVSGLVRSLLLRKESSTLRSKRPRRRLLGGGCSVAAARRRRLLGRLGGSAAARQLLLDGCCSAAAAARWWRLGGGGCSATVRLAQRSQVATDAQCSNRLPPGH